MIEHTTFTLSFDYEEEHKMQLQLRITETQTMNLPRIEFADNMSQNYTSSFQRWI